MVDGVRIAALPQANGITDTDVVAGVQNSATKKFPLTVILDWIRTRLTPASIGAQPTITASGILKGDGSGGVSAAVAGTDYQDPLTIDSTPTQSSANPVSSGGVYTALGSKADTKLGVYYAKCDTSAATQVKVISIPEITELYEGLSILVRFTYYQNYNGVPQLQINSLPAKDIRRNSTNDAARYEWRATEVVHLVYTGSYFQIVDGETASTTYYGYTKLSSSTNSTSTSLAATPSAVKAAYDLANGKQDAIAVSGILKGDGAGAVSAAAAGTDYQTPLVAGTDYQTPLTFDTAPTQDSTNPVTSGGVYTAIRDRNARVDSIFSTVTEITSGGVTITPTDDWAGYSYLAITLNTSSTNPAAERMALIVPVVLIQYNNWFPVARNGVYGAVQVGRVSNSSQLTFKTDLTSLYVVNVRRVK